MNADLEAAAVDAMAKALWDADSHAMSPEPWPWDTATGPEQDEYRDQSRAALAAVLGTTVEVDCTTCNGTWTASPKALVCPDCSNGKVRLGIGEQVR
jgi:hypothetical protein